MEGDHYKIKLAIDRLNKYPSYLDELSQFEIDILIDFLNDEIERQQAKYLEIHYLNKTAFDKSEIEKQPVLRKYRHVRRLIISEQEKTRFHNRVKITIKELQDLFLETFEKSREPGKLVTNEIEKYQSKLNSDRHKKLYDILIVRGDNNYEIPLFAKTDRDGYSFQDYINVEVWHAYLKWLQKFRVEKDVQSKQTKTEILKDQLSQYGFFELEKVKTLSVQSQVSLIERISENGLPYAIAMFDYLQFIQYLEREHFDSKYKLNKTVSNWFDSDKEGRAVKGNISSLLKNSTENKDRYTAHKHKEKVVNDYELLK